MEKVEQPASVIELSDDDDDEDNNKCNNAAIWHYMDPQGKTQGPFSLYDLKEWSNNGYFPLDLRVWKSSHTLDHKKSVLFLDLLTVIMTNTQVKTKKDEEKKVEQPASVIELSDDDDDEDNNKCNNAAIWHYMDPQGKTQVPFSLYDLKELYNNGYFPSDFRVWKSSHTLDDKKKCSVA
ncbi:hypothetical protein CASFOL_034063 [Castilleja foliolosa]|uniref:GYF domain-containing protein n=1 Tax=Castilleja foliolosa TaxID=1961234 RepID=A0ABD3C1D7_9LAMI